MRLIVAGSRDLSVSLSFINQVLNQFKLSTSEIVCGRASGIDECGFEYSKYHHLKLKSFHADWDQHGKAAGPIRNRQMASYADTLLLIWDGESRCSKNMKSEMQKLNKPIYEVILRRP